MGGPVEHFEDIGEIELPSVVEIDVGKDLVYLLLAESSPSDVVGPQKLLLADQPVVGVVDHLESLEVDPLAPIRYYFRSNQLQKLVEVDEPIPILVDLVHYHLQLFLLQGLPQTFENLIEFLNEEMHTLMEMEPEPSWSNILKASSASFSSLGVRYFLMECLTSYIFYNLYGLLNCSKNVRLMLNYKFICTIIDQSFPRCPPQRSPSL